MRAFRDSKRELLESLGRLEEGKEIEGLRPSKKVDGSD